MEHRLPLVILLLAGAACESPTGIDSRPDIGSVRDYVVGDAALALDGQGRFILRAQSTHGSAETISRERAADLAEAFIRSISNPDNVTIGQSVTAWLEERFGEPISWQSLRLDDRQAYFAESPYHELPDSLPGHLRRFYGPHYLAPFYWRGDHAVTVSVAAFATEVGISERGTLTFPRIRGNEFLALNLPRGMGVLLPLWPEDAVRMVFEATGARTREVPLLIQPGERVATHYARWRLVLDRHITVRRAADSTLLSTDTIYIAVTRGPTPTGQNEFGIHWLVPAEEQPVAELIRYVVPDTLPGPNEERTYLASLRGDLPMLYDFVFAQR